MVEVLQLFKGTEAGSPAPGCDLFAFCRESGAEDIRLGLNAPLKKLPCLSGIGDSQKGELFLIEYLRNLEKTVSVSSAFDDSHNILTGTLAGDSKVLAEGREINLGPRSWR
ncbi:MAG: hypothetical protein ACJAT6_001162 [Akkermansiaceae bacterium]